MSLLTFTTHTPTRPTPPDPNIARRRQLAEQVANYSQEEATYALQSSKHREIAYKDELDLRTQQGIRKGNAAIQQDLEDEKELQRLLNKKLKPATGWRTRAVQLAGFLLAVGIGRRLLDAFISKA